jgi:hypothetical protein
MANFYQYLVNGQESLLTFMIDRLLIGYSALELLNIKVEIAIADKIQLKYE